MRPNVLKRACLKAQPESFSVPGGRGALLGRHESIPQVPYQSRGSVYMTESLLLELFLETEEAIRRIERRFSGIDQQLIFCRMMRA